jgi:hypothetical protein
MKVKNDLLKFGTFTIKDGSHIRFWKDKWLANMPLRDQYPQLHNIARKSRIRWQKYLVQRFPIYPGVEI